MGNIIHTYNPFTVYGQYNLKKAAFENKQKFIIVLSIILIILIGVIIMLWTTDIDITPIPNRYKYNIPPPKYGLGPYGYGVYLPPTEILSSVVQ
jgi:hypothetical protein